MTFENLKLGVVSAFAALALTACPDNGNGDPDGGQDAGEELPEYVLVNFTVDASGRPDFYANGDLEWKGAFRVVAGTTTNEIEPDSNWGGPFPKLWDDGPVSAGGHEPEGAVAGDDKFGVQVRVDRPTEAVTFEYGAQIADGSKGCSGGCWIWIGSNGNFTVNPDDETVDAEGLVLPPEGPYDVRLTLNTADLADGFVLDDGETITVKGTLNSWSSDLAYDDGTHGDETADDGVYTYVLSENENRLKLAAGSVVEFIWNIGEQEYKNGSEGVFQGAGAAYTTDGTWTDATADIALATNGNPSFTLPE